MCAAVIEDLLRMASSVGKYEYVGMKRLLERDVTAVFECREVNGKDRAKQIAKTIIARPVRNPCLDNDNNVDSFFVDTTQHVIEYKFTSTNAM